MNTVFRPLKSLKRLARVAAGRDLWQRRQLTVDTLTLGGANASWTFCPAHLSPKSIVYSFGVGEEISFDLEMIERFSVTVHAFDPTPRTVKWLLKQALPAAFAFHPFGVGARDGPCRFLPPENPSHISHSLIPRETSRPAVELPVHRLPTILRMLGHERIDLLKMDIEGAEYEVIRDLLESKVNIRQLLVEFHHRWHEIEVNSTRQAIRDLNQAGYLIFHRSAQGDEYSFMNMRWQ